MAESKELKFRLVVDEASVQKVRRIIADIASDLSKLNETAGRSGFFGGTGGIPGVGARGGVAGISTGGSTDQKTVSRVPVGGQQLVQNLLDQKNLFKGIADGSKSSLQVMTDALKKAIGEQRSEVQKLKAALDSLEGSYRRFAGTPTGERIQSRAATVSGRLEKRRSALQELEAMSPRGELMPEVPWPEAGGGGAQPPGFGARMGAYFRGQGGPPGRPQWVTAAGRVGGAALATVGAGAAVGNSLESVLMGPQAFQAQRNKMFSPMMSGIAGGDLSWTIAMQRAARNGSLDLQSLRSFNAAAGGIMGSVGNLAGTFTGGAVGNANAPGGPLGGLTPEGLENAKMKSALGAVTTAREAMTIPQQMALQRFSGGMGERVSAMRMLGTGGLGLDPKTGKWTSQTGDLEAKLRGQGYSLGEYASSVAQMRSMAGPEGARMGYTAMAASAQGYGGFGPMAGMAQRRGAGQEGAFGALGGGVAKGAGIMLGQGVFGQGFDPMGTTSGLGTMAAIQGGMGFQGGAGDFNQVQRALAGLQMGSSVTTGGLDPYQQGRNLVAAMGRMPGASTYAQDYLANGMNMPQMLDMAAGGKLTATAEAHGITREQVRGQLGDSMSSVLDRYVSHGKADPMQKAIEAFRASGQDMPEYLQGLRKKGKTGDIRALGAAYGELTGQGEEAGLGLVGTLSGMGSKLTGGKIGGALSGAEKDFVKGLGEIQEGLETTIKSMGDTIAAAGVGQAAAFKDMGSISGNMDKSAGDMIEAMNKLTAAFLVNRARLGGGDLTEAENALLHQLTAPKPKPTSSTVRMNDPRRTMPVGGR
jgi:hypothetical protein